MWYNICPYTVTTTCDAVLLVDGDPSQDAPFPDLIQNAEENWSIQPAEVIKTFNVTHAVNAVGKRTFNSDGSEVQSPWQNARDFVYNRLVLGWDQNGNVYAPDSTANIFGQSSLGSGQINFGGLSPYNFARVESVDELTGSYGVTESWIAAAGSGTDIYSVQINQISEDPYTTVTASIQGVLHGFYVNLFDYDTRLLSAEWLWSQLAGLPLYSRVQSYVNNTVPSGTLNLNQQPLAGTLDYNYQEGSITYNFSYSNKLFNGDAFESYVVSRKTNIDNYKSQFSIAGQIKGRRYPNDNDDTVSFQRAYSLWNNLYVHTSGANPNDPTTFYNRIVSNTYFPEASGIGLQLAPIDRSIDYNQSEGLINYSFVFDNRLNHSGYFSNFAEEEFGITSNFSRDNGITTYAINGTVKGLNTNDVTPQFTKFENASGYFYNYVMPNLYNRVSSYYGVNLPFPSAQAMEISLQPILGNISYNFEFSNIPQLINQAALSEIITITKQLLIEDYNGIF